MPSEDLPKFPELTLNERDEMGHAVWLLTQYCHALAVEKGWWETSRDTIETKLLLMVTEIAEATEELRHPDPTDPDMVKLKTEIIDMIIRGFDLLGRLRNQDLYPNQTWKGNAGNLFVRKFLINQQREHRHGDKVI